MKHVKVGHGTGTLSRKAGSRRKPIVLLTIGLDAGEFSSPGWIDMTASDARKLALRLERAAVRAEIRLARARERA